MMSFHKVIREIKGILKKTKLKGNFFLWINLLLVVILFVLMFLTLKPERIRHNYTNEASTISPSNAKNKLTEEVKKDKFELPTVINLEIVNILRESYSIIDENARKLSLGGEINVGVNFSITWETEDSRKIIDIESPGVRWSSVNFLPEDVKVFKLEVLPKIESEFVKNGFAEDKKNSGAYPEYKGEFDMFYSGYYVFNKNDIKCTISTEPDTTKPTNISIICSDQYEKNYQAQTKFVNDLGSELSENAKIRPLGEVVLFDRYGIFTFVGSSQYFLVTGMMDANNKWHILWQGFTGDGLPCELLDEYPMFKQHYPTSYCFYREGKRTGEYVKWD